MKKNYLYFFIFVFAFCFCKLDLPARSIKIDSLRNLLESAKVDTLKVEIYFNLYQLSDSLFYGNKALELARKIKDTKSESYILFVIGNKYYFHEKYDVSLEYFVKAMKIAETHGFKDLLASIYLKIGYIYRPGDPSIAVEYYGKSLSIFKEYNDEHSMSYLYSAIGNVYEGLPGGDEPRNNKNIALSYYLKSLNIRYRLGSPGEVAASLNETSRIYDQLGRQDKALELQKKGLAIAEKARSVENIVYLSNLIGQDYFQKKNYKLALDYKLRAFKTLSESKNLNYTIMGEVSQSLGLTYAELKDYKKASEYFHLFIVCNDSLRARTNNVNLDNLKHTLAAESEKQHLLVKDAEIEKQKAIVDKQIIIRNTFIAGFVLLIALVIFIFRVYRQKQRTNRELDITNKKIEFAYKLIKEKTNEITDSIHYALRIQKATLPHRKDIWTALQKSFVLYKPKDIVSGDFYWFAEKDQTVFIAAMDCTGHGVPGAFMSIIGSERLNDAVHNENNPSKILSLLNQGIKASLRQSENVESTRDGMDIALCSIDLKNKVVNYAGANRPLWIIKKNTICIEEIKATKCAIGGLTKSDQHFETHTIQLEDGDTFYIFTDGYSDQDGGDKGKKLMTKKFRQILLDIQDKTMQEQEAYLEAYFEKWRGTKEQLDDILIIGVRI